MFLPLTKKILHFCHNPQPGQRVLQFAWSCQAKEWGKTCRSRSVRLGLSPCCSFQTTHCSLPWTKSVSLQLSTSNFLFCFGLWTFLNLLNPTFAYALELIGCFWQTLWQGMLAENISLNYWSAQWHKTAYPSWVVIISTFLSLEACST